MSVQGRVKSSTIPQASSAEAIDVSAADASFTDAVLLYVGTGGDVKVKMAKFGTTVTFTNVPDGTFLPIYVTTVYTADTTASDIVILHSRTATVISA